MQIDVTERKEQRKSLLGLRRSAWIEMALFFGILVLIDVVFFDFTRYWGVHPHPFWMVTLLLACQYGTREGIAAAIISIILYLLGNWPEQDFGEDRFTYLFNILIQPILWLVTAVIFGELRMRHIRERKTLEDELETAREREERIARAYEQVKEIKNGLELRTATQIRSSIAAHHALRTMDVLNESETMRGLENLAKAVSGVQKFSIYLITQNGLEARTTHGWEEEDQFSRVISPQDILHRTLLHRRTAISILNQDDEQVLKGHGMLAVPLIDNDSGEIFGMLKVESIPFTELNFHTVETFAAIGELGGMSFTNLHKYQTVQSQSMVNPEYGTQSYGYFYRYAEFISSLGRRLGFDVTMLVVKLSNAETLPYATRVQASKLFAETVDATLRKVDMTFDYQQNSEEFSIVLPATNVDGAEIVREKIQSQLTKALRTLDNNIRFSYTVEPLHAK
ncbi:MAG: GAF domain-containing protein [Alphaproteobacteria bacterium]|nr:GAF domain-containing protein [Alphaproteobacteria bacterium]